MASTQDLIRESLLELAVIDPIDPIPPDFLTLGLTRFNFILDQWNAQQISVYSMLFPTFSTTAGLSPHTIGVTADSPTWTITGNRPVDIVGANKVTGSGVNVVKIGPLFKRDRAWWLAQPVPGIQTGVPTDFYYEPTWPNGSMYLWPVPNAIFTVQLEMRVVLVEVAEADVTVAVTHPPGYRRALMLTLAEDLCGPLSVTTPQDLPRKAAFARGVIQGNNNPPVRIRTRQAGMPGGHDGPHGGGYSWQSGIGGGR